MSRPPANPLCALLDQEKLTHPKYGLFWKNFQHFLTDYYAVLTKDKKNIDSFIPLFTQVILLIDKQMHSPRDFPAYHKKERYPIDYYQIGLDMIRPLIDQKKSTVNDLSIIQKINDQLDREENVILFSNHQTEVEPQIISLILEEIEPSLAQRIHYIAGDRVTSDPLAAPFSAGVDLFCIYSKKYITEENKAEIIDHNKKTIQAIRKKLNEGGVCIYIACSGGRDRKNKNGVPYPAPFDPASIDLMYLLGEKAENTTHYYPLSLYSNPILPPPETTHKELGECRTTSKSPVHIYFSEEIDMKNIHSRDTTDKKLISKERAQNIYKMVTDQYDRFPIIK